MTFLRLSLYLAWCAAATAACTAETPPPKTAAEKAIEALKGCGLGTELEITDVAGAGAQCAGTLPGKGDTVRLLVAKDGGLSIQIGAWRLPRASGAGCSHQFAGCNVDSNSWLALNASLEGGVSKPKLTLLARYIHDHLDAKCPANVGYALKTAAPAKVATCAYAGAWTVAATPKLATGSCSYAWSAGQVTIADQGGKIALKWPGQSDPFVGSVNFATCSASATPVADQIYNGVVRTTSVSFKVTGKTLTGTIQDKLDGLSDSGDTCNASFSFSATLANDASAAAALPQDVSGTCGQRPYVCGDGKCEDKLGEGCRNCTADCGCAAGDQCLGTTGTGTCRTECNPEKTVCPATLRCEAPGADSGIVGDAKFCLPEGAGVPGGPCMASADCKAGTYCWRDGLKVFDWESAGVCAAPCDTSCKIKCMPNKLGGPAQLCPVTCARGKTGECPAGSFCYDKYLSWNYANLGFATLPPFCAALPATAPAGQGEPCLNDHNKEKSIPCGDGLICYTGKNYCAAACQTQADCPSDGGWTCGYTYSGYPDVKWCGNH